MDSQKVTGPSVNSLRSAAPISRDVTALKTTQTQAQTPANAMCASCGGCGTAAAKCGGEGAPSMVNQSASAGSFAQKPNSMDFSKFTPMNGITTESGNVVRGGMAPWGQVTVRANTNGQV